MAADERRLQILQVAVHLFSQHGFRGTTTREIANAAGVSEAMVFRHFATKQELYAAIIDYKACQSDFSNLRENFAELIQSKNDFQVFYTWALNSLNNQAQSPEFLRLMLYSGLENHELAEMFFERFLLNIRDFFGSYIRERQADGAFRDIDPHIIVRAFLGMILHHSLNNLLWDKDRRKLELSNEEAARQFTEILLGGIKLKNEKV
jgi:AcrR family transcriptional regulator